MLNKEQIVSFLGILNDKLNRNNLIGEIMVYGGAVMCLAHDARNVTYDIDAVFSPKREIEEYIKEIAIEFNLKDDWLNASVAGVRSISEDKNDFSKFLKFSNLTVYVANPGYMLALKCKSARIDYSYDLDDAKFLVNMLGIKSKKEVDKIVLKYFPKEEVDFKVEYFIKLIFEERD
jgi:hypothetical protein